MADGEHDDGPSPKAILGLLAGADRRSVLAAVILGHGTVDDIARVTGLTPEATAKALERLAGGGLIERTLPSPTDRGGTLRVPAMVFEHAGREAARLRLAVTPEDLGATTEQATGLRNWLTEDGRLKAIPTQRTRRLPILDFLASKFEPGKTYPEGRVNLILGEFHSDTAALRRHLVDEEFLERRDGFYWRAGGTFLIDAE